MRHDQTIDRLIGEKIKADNDRNDHVSSGKLSASSLGKPLQWQILKTLKVPSREIDEYVYRKFLRGNHVETYLLSHMIGVQDTQKFVEYKDCIGYVDAVVNSDLYEFKFGVIPHEIKSVSNLKYKKITKSNEADPQHKLQAGLYALAMKADHYAIDYVATDDYRVVTYIYETKDIAGEIDDNIAQYNEAIKNKVIPVFTPKYDWQKKLDYCDYPDFMNLTEIELAIKAKELYEKRGDQT